MKKAILSVILIASGLLSGCSSEESVSRPETIGQTGTLTFSFPVARRSVTYSIDDADTTAGEPDETGVDAVGDETVINDVTVYMFENSGSELLKARKSVIAEGGTGVESVTLDVSDFANGSDYVFYAVANVRGNIEDGFEVGTADLDGFTAAVTLDTGTGAISGSNMLMVGYTTIPDLSVSTSSGQEIVLRHRVARFDIRNTTRDDNFDNDNMNPEDDGYNASETFFTITRIHVLNTLDRGYLTAEDNGRDGGRTPLATMVSLSEDNAIDVSEAAGINNGLAEGAFYLWPGKLAGKADLSSGFTVIEVEGYSDNPLEPVLFTVQLDGAQLIEANTRYILTVKRISQTALTFTLTASKWANGIEVPSDLLTGTFEYAGFSLNGSQPDNDLEDIDLSGNTGDNELTFYTLSDVKITGALKAGLALDLGEAYEDSIKFEAVGNPVVTYSVGKIRQDYKITLPKTIYPINGVLTIEERDKGEGANKTKTFNITSVPFYPDTNLKPVRVGGKYWAPVNVGATSTTYSANLAGCGYVFQWGRSYVGFTYGSTSDTFGGPVSATDAETTYAGKFITASEAPNDWLNSQNDLLWSGENAQGPCPAGWRVPTEAELTVLNSKYSTANIEGAPGNIRLKIPGDVEGKDLYLPAAGSRTYSPGAWDGQGMAGRYWSSSVDGTNARRFYFGSGSSNMISTNRATGFSVRCIQE